LHLKEGVLISRRNFGEATALKYSEKVMLLLLVVGVSTIQRRVVTERKLDVVTGDTEIVTAMYSLPCREPYHQPKIRKVCILVLLSNAEKK